MPFKPDNTFTTTWTTSLSGGDIHYDDKKKLKKIKKVIKKNTALVQSILEEKYNCIIYTLDKDLHIEPEKEKYYNDLFGSIMDNYENIIMNDYSKFYIRTESERIILILEQGTDDQISIEIYPYSITTKNNVHGDCYEFSTKENLFFKYYKKALKVESFMDHYINKEKLDRYKSKYKLDRSKNIDKILD